MASHCLDSLDLIADTMHFCVRPSCRRWYHRACLLDRKRYVEDPEQYIPGSRLVRLVGVDPQNEGQGMHPRLAKYAYPRLFGGEMFATDLCTLDVYAILERELEAELTLPASLVRVAATPITRRPDLPAPFNIMGNMSDVLLARSLVHQEFELTHDEVSAQIDKLFESYGGSRLAPPKAEMSMVGILSDQNIVASPLPRYWDSLERNHEELYGANLKYPDLFCPNCSGPV